MTRLSLLFALMTVHGGLGSFTQTFPLGTGSYNQTLWQNPSIALPLVNKGTQGLCPADNALSALLYTDSAYTATGLFSVTYNAFGNNNAPVGLVLRYQNGQTPFVFVCAKPTSAQGYALTFCQSTFDCNAKECDSKANINVPSTAQWSLYVYLTPSKVSAGDSPQNAKSGQYFMDLPSNFPSCGQFGIAASIGGTSMCATTMTVTDGNNFGDLWAPTSMANIGITPSNVWSWPLLGTGVSIGGSGFPVPECMDTSQLQIGFGDNTSESVVLAECANPTWMDGSVTCQSVTPFFEPVRAQIRRPGDDWFQLPGDGAVLSYRAPLVSDHSPLQLSSLGNSLVTVFGKGFSSNAAWLTLSIDQQTYGQCQTLDNFEVDRYQKAIFNVSAHAPGTVQVTLMVGPFEGQGLQSLPFELVFTPHPDNNGSPSVVATAVSVSLAVVFLIGLAISCFFVRRKQNRPKQPTGMWSHLLDEHDMQTLATTSNEEAITLDEAVVARGLAAVRGAWRIDAKDLVIGGVLGHGAFGAVAVGHWRGVACAVKQFPMLDALLSQKGPPRVTGLTEMLDEVLGEAAICTLLRHPRIVEFYGVCINSNKVMLVTELCEGGDLDRLIRKEGTNLGWPCVIALARDIAEGMHYLHTREPPLVHRDLKPHNVLLTKDGRAKVGDYGNARVVSAAEAKGLTARVGTPCYMAPEIIEGEDYTEAVDVYSFGIMLLEMASGDPVYRKLGLRAAEIAMKVLREGMRPEVSRDIPTVITDLIRHCWSQAPQDRPTFAEISTRLTAMAPAFGARLPDLIPGVSPSPSVPLATPPQATPPRSLMVRTPTATPPGSSL